MGKISSEFDHWCVKQYTVFSRMFLLYLPVLISIKVQSTPNVSDCFSKVCVRKQNNGVIRW